MESAEASIHHLLAGFDWISEVTHSRDFDALLHSNDPPSLPQSVDLKHSAKNMECISQKIQAALNLLGNAVMTLEAHMSRVQYLQRDYEVMLSPMRRVPVDIIMEIMCCMQIAEDGPGEATLGGYNVFTRAEGPHLLAQVCSSWQDIVNAHPKLWATMTISVHIRRSLSWTRKFFVEMLEYALERTRGHPLDFLFEHHQGPLYQDSKIMDSCFDVLMGHSAQWRRAIFIVPAGFLPHLCDFRGRIDFLEDAYVNCCGDTGPQPSHVTGFAIAPRLKSLHLAGIDESVRFPFPTANLISFYDERGSDTADELNPAEYVRIVKSSPKLISFSAHDNALPWAFAALPSHRITSKSIQTLSVSSEIFLNMLDAPSLREVVLKPTLNMPRLRRELSTPLFDLLRHPHCSLTRLSLTDVIIFDNDLVKVLRLTPSLCKLSLWFNVWYGTGQSGMESLIDSLAEAVFRDGQVQHSLVPSLTSLGMVLSGVALDEHISFINATFVTMVTSRHETRILKKLILHIMGPRWTFGLKSADETDFMLLQLSGLALDYVAKDCRTKNFFP